MTDVVNSPAWQIVLALMLAALVFAGLLTLICELVTRRSYRRVFRLNPMFQREPRV